MTDGRNTQWYSSEWFSVLLSLWALASLVVAQPVYEVLAGNLEFLAVRRVDHSQSLVIILVFNLLPPLALFLLWALFARRARGWARSCLAVSYFFLFLAFFWQVHNAYLAKEVLPRDSYPFWVIPAAFLARASLRFEKAFRSYVLVLSPAVLLFPSLFLYRTWSYTADAPPPEPVVAKAVSLASQRSFPPIFLLVFDEFTLHALLDPSGQIDGDRFPHFKALAEESHWFRNATTNAPATFGAIAALLTGNYPRPIASSYRSYPNNLFVWLQPFYEISVYELHTQFCDPRQFRCLDASGAGSRAALLRDVFYLYATRVVPKGLHVGLPETKRAWGPFGSPRADITARLRRFQEFVDSLPANITKNRFFYFHHMLPHSPYMLTRDGQLYDTHYGQGILGRGLKGNRLAVEDLRKRYLMQVGYVDKEVGRFLARLKQVGLFDRALLIVTGDHGISWRLEAPGRGLSSPANAAMVLTVPFFIKVPFQKRGVMSERDVQHIDVLPTIADLLGLPVPWPLAGRSVFSPVTSGRKKLAYNKDGRRFEYPDTLGLARVEVAFDAPPAGVTSPWIGQQVSSFEVEQRLIQGHIEPLSVSPYAGRVPEEEVPVYVAGWIEKSVLPAHLAIVLNGEIVAIVSPQESRPGAEAAWWYDAFSSRKLRKGINEVDVFLVLNERPGKLAAFGRSMSRTVNWPPPASP